MFFFIQIITHTKLTLVLKSSSVDTVDFLPNHASSVEGHSTRNILHLSVKFLDFVEQQKKWSEPLLYISRIYAVDIEHTQCSSVVHGNRLLLYLDRSSYSILSYPKSSHSVLLATALYRLWRVG